MNIKKILLVVSAVTLILGAFTLNIPLVAAISPLVLSPSSPNVPPYSSIPSGTVTAPYDFTFGATGGIGQYTWHIFIEGNPGGPPGLTLSSSGELQGTPTTAGPYTIEIQVTDQSSDITTQFYNLTINPAVNVAGVSITNPTSTMSVGQTYQFIATTTPSNATNKNVTWSSNNTSTVTVDNNGLVTAASGGSATITATTVDGGFTATDPITVNMITSLISLPVIGGSCAPRDTSFPYLVVDLGPGTAQGISNNGQVVGQGSNGTAFLYASGTIKYFIVGTAYGINNSGQAVGVNSAGDIFLYSSSTIQDLGQGTAFGINNIGQIIGSSNGHAFLRSGSTILDLGAGKASGINNNGQVVGLNSSFEEVFLYPQGATSTITNDTGFPTFGPVINNGGDIAGTTEISGGGWTNAFLYSKGTVLDLGGLSYDIYGRSMSQGLGINDSDQVVGWSYSINGSQGNSRAFIYSNNGPILDLNDLIGPSTGWTLEQANAINDAGQIVGFGTNSSGQTHAFLLIPNNLCPPSSGILTVSIGGLNGGDTAQIKFLINGVATDGPTVGNGSSHYALNANDNYAVTATTTSPNYSVATSTGCAGVFTSQIACQFTFTLATSTPTSTPVIVSSTVAIPNISVANGTVLSGVGLPATTTVTLSDATTTSLIVAWNGGAPVYNATASGTYTFTGTFTLPVGVTNPNSVKASVNVNVAPAPITTYAIIAAAGIGGTISPSGTISVPSGTDQTFIITANPGFDLNGKIVDGVPVGGQIVGPDSYTFTDVTASHTIVANFFASALATVTVIPATSTLPVAGTEQLTATTRDQAGLPFVASVTWSSSNAGIAKVSSSGLVTAVASGTASITAASGASSTVTWIPAIVMVTAPTSTPSSTPPVASSTPRAQKLAILSELNAFQKTLSNKQDKNTLNEAIICVNNSLNPKWWIDSSNVVHATSKGGEVFFNEECSALYLGQLISNHHASVNTSTLQGFVTGLVADDRLLATIEIGEAVASSGRSSYITNANSELSTADAFVKKGNAVKAIDNYEPAWEWALRSLNGLSR
jgi:probable HAF family extracellular repeat protein